MSICNVVIDEMRGIAFNEIEILAVYSFPLSTPVLVDTYKGTEKLRETYFVKAIVDGTEKFYIKKPKKGNYMVRDYQKSSRLVEQLTEIEGE